MIQCIILVILFFLYLLFGIIIHEIGHVLFGLFFRFNFLYIDIMGCRISKSKISFSQNFKINAKTSMYPIGLKYIIIRALFYYSGGIILTGISMLLLIYLTDISIYNLVLKISFFVTLIMSLLPYKKSDIYYIIQLLNNKTTAIILIPFYLFNGISPKNMPDKWFANLINLEVNLQNLLLFKMSYYRELELKNNIVASLYFYKIYNLLLKSKYLADKCEILFFIAIIENKLNDAIKLSEILSGFIKSRNFTSKLRLLEVLKFLNKESNYHLKISQENTLSGLIILERNIINNYFVM